MIRTTDGDLVTGTVDGDRLTHLFEGAAEGSLCSRSRLPDTARPSLRTAPCGQCVDAARGRGYTMVREHGSAWVNLLRIA